MRNLYLDLDPRRSKGNKSTPDVAEIVHSAYKNGASRSPARPEPQLDHIPGNDPGGDGVKHIGQRLRHRALRARLVPMRRAGEQQRKRREPRERRGLAAIGEALGADEIFGDRAEDQRERADEEIDMRRDDLASTKGWLARSRG